jgi:preprotein translocase subunit SecE
MKNPFTKIRTFYWETLSELKKASWPTRKELVSHTIMVLTAVILLGAYIALADFSVREVITLLIQSVR